MIGNYRPAQKWLKDRLHRNLEMDDVDHYQRMICALLSTVDIMRKIDGVWMDNQTKENI
jgi:hypothetical protein